MGDDPAPGQWPRAWSRVALPTAVLAVLDEADLHGYAIATAVAARGFGRPRGGSLYPLLGRLEEQGLIDAVWDPASSGPGRRTYRLTSSGVDQLATDLRDWAALLVALDGHGSAEGTS